MIASLIQRSQTLTRSDTDVLNAVFDEVCRTMAIGRQSADAERLVSAILDLFDEGEIHSGDLTQKVIRFWRVSS